MNKTKWIKALLFPPTPLLVMLTPLTAAFLIYCMLCLSSESLLAIVSYVLAAYTLTVWSIRVPRLIRFFRAFKSGNKYALRWQRDERLRISVSLCSSLLWNIAYAAFQFRLGYLHHSFWFYSLAGYYLSLALMRLPLMQHTCRYRPGEHMCRELRKYRRCGWSFLGMNLALALMVFFMVSYGRTFDHSEIITITMAAYTFTSFTVAIVNIIKYRVYNSPVYSAAKAISLASALVSLLTLESTMLTTFDNGNLLASERKWLLGLSGGIIVAFIIVMAVYMILHSTKKLKKQSEEEKHHEQ